MQVRKRYRFSLVGFHDDIFTFNENWLAEFSEKYARQVNIPFWCNSRVDCIDERKIRLLKQAGCVRIQLGIESGSEKLRRKILKRKFSNQQIREAFAMINKYNIKTLSFNMIGIPYETEEDILETIKLNRSIRPNRVHLTVFYPYPNTELFEVCKQEGWLGGQNKDNFYDPGTCLNQDTISPATIKKYTDEFIKRVYK